MDRGVLLVFGFAMGMVAGAVLVMCLSSDRGESARKRIMEEGSNIMDRVEPLTKEARNQSERILSMGKEGMDAAKSKLEEQGGAASNAAARS